MSSALLPTAALKTVKGPVIPLFRAAQASKQQPWKAFWPLDPAKYTEAERARMPWLTYKYDASKSGERPWRKWMLENQTTVVRRGSW